ncbi:MAG TPA: energy transducer TonB [Terriglobia bacterium]|nr:energy transducer TonB [Terriglobia bacterium]
MPVLRNPKQAARLALTRPAPEYPPVAKVNYLQGLVQIRITVSREGKVLSAHVLHGNAILAEAALTATRRWIYRPLATAAGPSGFITTVNLKFTLGNLGTDLTPQQAEHDFLRQVKPPQMEQPPQAAPSREVVHMRLLVNDQGQVVDRDVPPVDDAQFEAACETLRSWTFRPAHWGNLPIASYFDVDVPVSAPPLVGAAAISRSR